MAATNEITGDALISKSSSRAYRNNFDMIENAKEEEKVFQILYCSSCLIKVSTSNGCCPCCGKGLT